MKAKISMVLGLVLFCWLLVRGQDKIPFVGLTSGVHATKTNKVIWFRALTNSTSSTQAAEYTTPAFTPTANALIICTVITSKASTPEGHTVNSLHGFWRQLFNSGFNTLGTPLNRLTVWYCKVTNAVSSTLTNTTAAVNQTGCLIQVVEFNDVDMTDDSGIWGIRQSNIQTADATANPGVTLSPVMFADASGVGRNAAFAICGAGDVNPANITNEVNWITNAIGNIGYNTPSTGLFTSYRLAHTDSSITFSNNASEDRIVGLLEIRVAP